MESERVFNGLEETRREGCVEISMPAADSTLRVTGGRDIAFRRAKLIMRNIGSTELAGFLPRATLLQERGLIHDATEALSRGLTAQTIPAGGDVVWDVYDLLLAAHGGVASKVHLWGYKAVLEWWFELTAWAEYRTRDDVPAQTPVFRRRFKWSPAKGGAEGIGLTIEEGTA